MPRTNPRLRAGLYVGGRLLATPEIRESGETRRLCPVPNPFTPPTTRMKGKGPARDPRAGPFDASAARARIAYLVIFETTPEPTVRPPSRIAKRRPSSIAIGAISLTPIVTLSPGITISVPSGRMTSPVTSVVRK